MSCTPNTEITWAHVYALAQSVDDLAVQMSTPGYAPLSGVSDMPFIYSTTKPFTGALWFQLSPGTNTVDAQYLAVSEISGQPYTLEPTMREMAQADDLYFLAEPDDCLCRTLFKVEADGTRAKLTEVTSPALGCCQTLPVPQPGDLLDGTQHLIPGAKTIHFAALGNPGGNFREERNLCTARAGGALFHFAWFEAGDDLVAASRPISGKFVWPIRKKYMQEIWERIRFILECSRNGGAIHEQVMFNCVYDEEEGYQITWINTGCEVTAAQLLYTLTHQATIQAGNPGCLNQGLYDLSCSAPTQVGNDVVDLPWDAPTCSGADCDAEGPKFYCETLTHLEALVTAIPQKVQAYTGPSNNGCCCSVSVEYDTIDGAAAFCGGYDDDGCYTNSSVTFECVLWGYPPDCDPNEDPPDPDCVLERLEDCTWTGTSSISGGVIDLNGETGCSFSSSGSPCASYCAESEIPISSSTSGAVGCPTPSGMAETAGGYALAHATHSGLSGWLGACADVGYGCICEVFCSHLWWCGLSASATRGRWRLRATLQDNPCPLQPIPSVAIEIVTILNGVEVNTESRTLSLNWDNGEGALVSAWQSESDPSLISDWGDRWSYNIRITDNYTYKCTCQ